MAYQINKTDGTIVATVADGQVDDLSTDLTLIGKNFSGFGEALNENFIKLLENFADTARPSNPIKGQLWFDSSELKLKVYSGTEFLPVSSATIASSRPINLGVGDLWFNDIDKQLYFFDGTDPILLGPAFSASQGISGIKVESVLDTLNQNRVITLFYTNGILLGIFSKDSFTPKLAIPGFAGPIIPGFNAGTLEGIKFNVTATNADQLGGAPATLYVRTDTSNIINGQLRLTSDLGLVIGSAGQANLRVSNGNVLLTNAASNRNLIIDVRKDLNQEEAILINAESREIDLYKNFLDSQINVGGSLTVDGDLTVNGTTTTINTNELVVEDKSITLAKQSGIVPTDSNASGGGLILQGSAAHIFLWADSFGLPATTNSSQATNEGYEDQLPELAGDAWNSTEHINLVTPPEQGASAPEFKINGQTVLSENSLGPGITSIPGVSTFGKQNVINVGPGTATQLELTNIKIENNRISTEQENLNLELAPNGTGNIVLIGQPKITGLANPSASQDAATKEYVDNTIQTRNIVLSIDLTDNKPNSYIIANILNNIAPIAEYRNGTRARLLCSVASTNSVALEINPLISLSTQQFLTSSGSAPAVTNLSVSQATILPQPITITRIIKIFEIINNQWTHVSDSLLPS